MKFFGIIMLHINIDYILKLQKRKGIGIFY